MWLMDKMRHIYIQLLKKYESKYKLGKINCLLYSIYQVNVPYFKLYSTSGAKNTLIAWSKTVLNTA